MKPDIRRWIAENEEQLIEAVARALYNRDPVYAPDDDVGVSPSYGDYYSWDDLIRSRSSHAESYRERANSALYAIKQVAER